MPTVVKKAPPKKEKATAVKKEKVPKKEATQETEKKYGIERDHDLPWNDKKVALFKALKTLKATSEQKAVTAQQVVESSGEVLATKDVRHYSYHAKAAGLVEVAEVEGVRGYSFFLTTEGAKVNPDKALAQQEKEKAAKQKAAE